MRYEQALERAGAFDTQHPERAVVQRFHESLPGDTYADRLTEAINAYDMEHHLMVARLRMAFDEAASGERYNPVRALEMHACLDLHMAHHEAWQRLYDAVMRVA